MSIQTINDFRKGLHIGSNNCRLDKVPRSVPDFCIKRLQFFLRSPFNSLYLNMKSFGSSYCQLS